jgi:uncharacterized protein YfaS (alpha-2-macroglobulin family)
MPEHIADLAESYIHDLLDQPDAARVQAHCEACHVCREAVDQARARLARFKAVKGAKASPQLVQATLAKMGAAGRRVRWRTRFACAALGSVAAAAILLVCMNAYVQNMEATPYDLILLGQRDLLASANFPLRVRLLDRKANAAVAGAKLTIELIHAQSRKVEVRLTSTTDANGGCTPVIPIQHLSGDYDLRVTAETPKGPEVIEEHIHIARSWKIMLTSDKPVYQPGQTIHLRALALQRLNLKPASEQEAVFTIADPHNNIIFKDEGKTSRFGIAATDCPLASEILEGDYVVSCKIGDTQTRLVVEVKKYTLPKFKVDVTFDRPFYQPGDTVKATVHADYFFGKPVANGTVEIQLKGEKNSWTERTDEQGVYTLDYTIPKNLAQADRDASLGFEVKVTDSARQVATQRAERRVTRNAVHLDVIPENGRLVSGVSNKVYVLTSTADGRPLPLRILASVGEQEIRTATNDLGVGVFEIKPSGQSTIATVRVLLPKSLSVRSAVGVAFDASRGLDGEGTVLARRRVDLGGFVGNDFLLRTDKAVYTAGDLLTVHALGGSAPVFVDLIKEGQTIVSDTIAIQGNEGECRLQLPLELAGTTELCAYRLDGGAAIQKTRVVYVRTPDQVQIATTIDDKPYRPGQQAKLNFRLTDAKGAPVQGALSLVAVDEAVLSVIRERPGMERDFYSLKPEMLATVTRLGSWPLEQENSGNAEENALREQALVAGTVAPGRRHHTYYDETHLTHLAEIKKAQGIYATWIARGWFTLVVFGLVVGYCAFWLYGIWLRFSKELITSLHVIGGMLLLPLVCGIAFLPLGDNEPIWGTIPNPQRAATKKNVQWRLTEGAMTTNSVEYFDDSGSMSQPASETMGFYPPATSLVVRAGSRITGRFRPMLWEEFAKAYNDPVRIREYFPETLRWEPQLITDEEGRTSLDLELADSITSWRLSASAVTADGRLGATEKPLKVFQPFFVDLNLPVALTRGDEVAVPVVVYNYLDRPQTVVLTLADGDWFTRLEDAEKRVELAPGQVLATSYRLRVDKVGDHALTVTARGGDVSDAVKRRIEVLPNGRRFEEVTNGSLQDPATVTLDVPQNAVEGSAKAVVKIYPSGFSQLVEGLDGIFRMPSGCFEQTSSTTYPNILALDYLQKSRQSQPEIEKKAQQYIHLGYQRLLSFEVSGGGFDWFGRAPANRTLTAYGLMEFEDMARVHSIDPQIISRTQKWLLQQRNKDGSWTPEGHVPHDAVDQTGDEAEQYLAATAYIAWAVFADPKTTDADGKTRTYLKSFSPEEIKNPYTLALVCLALGRLDADAAKKYLGRLDRMKTAENQGRLAHWSQPRDARTAFHGTGRSGDVETTALAALALQRDGNHRATAGAALAWLVTQKDARGTWHSTQATVLSLKALLGGMSPGGDDKERRVEVRLDDRLVEEIVIPANRSEVMAQLDLSKHLIAGRRQLMLREKSDTAAGYQVMFRYHVDGAMKPDQGDLLAVDLAYDRTELTVGDVLTAKAKVTNRMDAPAAMVMLDLPVPAGFAPILDDIEKLQEQGVVAKFQVLPQSVLLYLRELLPAGKPLEVTHKLRATMPVELTASGARVYEYYDPDRQAQSAAARIKVKPVQ